MKNTDVGRHGRSATRYAGSIDAIQDRSANSRATASSKPPIYSRADGQYASAFQARQHWPAPSVAQRQPQSPWMQFPQSHQQVNQWHGQPQVNTYADNYRPVAYAGMSPVMYNLWSQQPQMRTKVEAAGTVIQFLNHHGINAHLGGSLAAMAYGTSRDPQDLDIYVSNPVNIDNAYEMLSRLDTVATTPDGQMVRIQGRPQNYYHPGRLGQIGLNLTYQNGQSQTVSADIVNENAPGLGKGLLSPAQRGVPDFPGNLSAPDLVVGFLRRHVMQPQLSASKGDVYQIAAIIRNAGIDPMNPVTYFELVDALAAQFQPQQADLVKSKMREILHWMSTGQI